MEVSSYDQICRAVDRFLLTVTQNGHQVTPMSIEDSCDNLRKELNKFFTDFTCVDVHYTPNTDKQFFGVFVVPCGAKMEPSEFTSNMFEGLLHSHGSIDDRDFEPFKATQYKLEIDGKMLKANNITAEGITAIIIGEIATMNSTEPYEKLRNIIDAQIAINNIQLNSDVVCKSTVIFQLVGIITLHNLTSVFAKYGEADVRDILYDLKLGDYFKGAIKTLQEWNEWYQSPVDNTAFMVKWYFSTYTYLYENRYVEFMLRDSIETESSLYLRTLMKSALNSIVRVNDRDERYYSDLLTESAKKRGLIWQMKRNGIKSIEEDLFEYTMRLRNVENQDEAILLMRQINSRMSILEDYIRDEDIDDADRERWTACYQRYLELREALSKKTVYNKKMYGLFVDYNALKNMNDNGSMMNTYESAINTSQKKTKNSSMINEGLFDKFKKNKNPQKTEPEKPKVETSKDDIKKAKTTVTAKLKQIISKYNSSAEHKKEIRNAIDKQIKEAAEYYEERGKVFKDQDRDFGKYFTDKKAVPRLTCDVFEDYDYSITYSIFDGTQEMRIALGDIIYDICDELKDAIDDIPCFKYCDSGDGDEGCIYVDFRKYVQEQSVDEGFFDKFKPKYKYVPIEHTDAKVAVPKIIDIAKAGLNRVYIGKYTTWNLKLGGKKQYDEFMSGKSDDLGVAEYNLENFNKLHKNWDSNDFTDEFDKVDSAIDKINEAIEKAGIVGYEFYVIDGDIETGVFDIKRHRNKKVPVE